MPHHLQQCLLHTQSVVLNERMLKLFHVTKRLDFRDLPGKRSSRETAEIFLGDNGKQWNRENEKQGQGRGNGSRMRQEGKTVSPRSLRKPKKTFSHNMQVGIVWGAFLGLFSFVFV